MPDWNDDLRQRLATLRLSPTREADIIEELSQHLDQRYEELRAAGKGEREARHLATLELDDSEALARHMRRLRQAHVPPPITPGVPARGSLRGGLAGPPLRRARAPQAAGVRGRRDPDTRARHRRQQRDLRARRRDAAAPSAVRQPGSAGDALRAQRDLRARRRVAAEHDRLERAEPHLRRDRRATSRASAAWS